MSRVKSKNSHPELLVRTFLFKSGMRFRIHQRNLPGNPDIVLKKYKKVIFVNGCFWHGHNCKKGVLPSSRKEYWGPKILNNINRDVRNDEAIRKLGWDVIYIWECELKASIIEQTFKRLLERIRGL